MKPLNHSDSAAREAGSLFSFFHGSLPIAAFWKDRSLRFRECNQRFVELFGFSDAGAPIGRLESEFVSPAQAQLLREIDQQVIATGMPVLDREETVILANGQEAVLLTSRSPMRDESGAIIGVFGTFQDITSQRESERQLIAHQQELERRNQAIEFDLDSARQIQKFLMGRKAEPCGFLDVHYRYRYMEKVGGDYVSLRSFDDRSYSMLLADLTGHGVTAALFMALIKYISKEAPEEVRSLPAYFLSYLDMEFFGQIPNGFFTAFSATCRWIEPERRVELEYASAAHPIGIVLRKNGQVERLLPGDFAVGLLDFIERESRKLTLEVGDRVFAYTDGFVEATNDAGEEFGLDRFERALAATLCLPLNDAIDALYETIDAYTGCPNGQDDMTILAAQVIEPSTTDEHPTDPLQDWGSN